MRHEEVVRRQAKCPGGGHAWCDGGCPHGGEHEWNDVKCGPDGPGDGAGCPACERVGSEMTAKRSEAMRKAEDSPRIISKKPLVWKMSPPVEFKCFMCREEEAEWKVGMRKGEVSVNVCLCNVCAILPEWVIGDRFLGRK